MENNNQPNWDAKEKAMYHMNYYRTLLEWAKGGQLLPEDVNLMAKKQVEDTWNTYHTEPVQANSKPMQQMKQISNEAKCPDCGGIMKEKSGVKNGRKWSGEFCQNPNCKKVIWMPKMTRQQTDRAMAEDSNFEANLQENYDGEYGNHYDRA